MKVSYEQVQADLTDFHTGLRHEQNCTCCPFSMFPLINMTAWAFFFAAGNANRLILDLISHAVQFAEPESQLGYQGHKGTMIS